MKRTWILALALGTLLSGCFFDMQSGSENDDENENSAGIISHNQGGSCLSCHGVTSATISGEEDAPRFYSGATVYTALNGNDSSTYASGFGIQARLENGQIVPFQNGYGSANAWSLDSRLLSYRFSAEVVDANGNVVNASLQNSHDASRLDCNTCHSVGSSQAPGRIVSYDYYASQSQTTTTTNTTVSFQNDVLAILNTNCSGCHGTNGNFTLTSTSIAPYDSTVLFVDTQNVDSSPLLQKASGNNHGGGAILGTTSVEYTTLREWISQGAMQN